MTLMRIAVFTSSRSEYGVLRPLIQLLHEGSDIELLLLAGGGHLAEKFGYTKTDIVADGYPIAAEFDFLTDPDSENYLTDSLAKLQAQSGKWLYENRPDWLVVLGDRFELLAVAASALMTQTPLAHISGGDVTEGALDNQVRHAVTKLSHAHFPGTAAAREMLLDLNEDESRICLSGEPGLDQIASMDFIGKDELFAQLGLDTSLPTALVTFHPDTLTNVINADFVKEVIAGLTEKHGLQVMATGSNFDEGGDAINQALQEIAATNLRVKFLMSLGQLRYYSMPASNFKS